MIYLCYKMIIMWVFPLVIDGDDLIDTGAQFVGISNLEPNRNPFAGMIYSSGAAYGSGGIAVQGIQCPSTTAETAGSPEIQCPSAPGPSASGERALPVTQRSTATALSEGGSRALPAMQRPSVTAPAGSGSRALPLAQRPSIITPHRPSATAPSVIGTRHPSATAPSGGEEIAVTALTGSGGKSIGNVQPTLSSAQSGSGRSDFPANNVIVMVPQQRINSAPLDHNEESYNSLLVMEDGSTVVTCMAETIIPESSEVLLRTTNYLPSFRYLYFFFFQRLILVK
jgi:hypothetical protein